MLNSGIGPQWEPQAVPINGAQPQQVRWPLQVQQNLPPDGADEFISSRGEKQGFSVFRAGKEFLKGIFRPLVTMIKHPLMTVAAIGGGLLLSSVAPVTIPLLLIAGGVYGGIQLFRGVKNVAQHAMAGDNEGAEKAFGEIGEGTFALATSALGVRSGGAIAAEARATTTAMGSATNAAERVSAIEKGIEAASQVKGGTWLNALKENVMLLTSKSGWQASWSQLNPMTLSKNLVTKLGDIGRMFTTMPTNNIQEVSKKIQQHLKLADEDMPKIVENLNRVDGKGNPLYTAPGNYAFYDSNTHTCMSPKTALNG
jgi:hypothetical protein